jgi:hypothetical protein
MSIEGISGLGSSGEGIQPAEKGGKEEKEGDVAQKIRCEGCGNAFCVTCVHFLLSDARQIAALDDC